MRLNGRAALGLPMVALFALAALVGPCAAPYGPRAIDLAHELSPAAPGHLLGTGENGVDVLSVLLHGARLAGLVAQRAIVECDTRHAALMLLSPLLLALLHQNDLGGTRCRPLSLPALIDEHVRVFARAYRVSPPAASGTSQPRP